jgi:hypothetical protein
MLVRLLIGQRAGEIHEMKFADAQRLIAVGHAELPIKDSGPPAKRELDTALTRGSVHPQSGRAVPPARNPLKRKVKSRFAQ